jgi:hypothetical protein
MPLNPSAAIAGALLLLQLGYESAGAPGSRSPGPAGGARAARRAVSVYTHAAGVKALRGGMPGRDDVVLPAAGPPVDAGVIRQCAACNKTETQITLAYCRVTELHFCQTKVKLSVVQTLHQTLSRPNYAGRTKVTKLSLSLSLPPPPPDMQEGPLGSE